MAKKRLHQETMEMDEHKPQISITQIRKVVEYIARADWHYRRGNVMPAKSLLGNAKEVLKGCEVPKEDNIRQVYWNVTMPPYVIDKDFLRHMLDRSMLGLEAAEKALVGDG